MLAEGRVLDVLNNCSHSLDVSAHLTNLQATIATVHQDGTAVQYTVQISSVALRSDGCVPEHASMYSRQCTVLYVL